MPQLPDPEGHYSARNKEFALFPASLRGRPLDIQEGGLGRSGDEKLFISRQSDAKIFFSHSRDAKIFV